MPNPESHMLAQIRSSRGRCDVLLLMIVSTFAAADTNYNKQGGEETCSTVRVESMPAYVRPSPLRYTSRVRVFHGYLCLFNSTPLRLPNS